MVEVSAAGVSAAGVKDSILILSPTEGHIRKDAGGGDNMMTGRKGAARFIFAGRFGADLITDFHCSVPREVLDLSGAHAAASFAAAWANNLNEVDGNAVLTFGAQLITIEGLAMARLTASDF